MKFWPCLVAASLCVWLSAPASADTIATFTLDGVTFDDGGTAAGGFDYDVNTGAVSNVNITGTPLFGLTPFTWCNACAQNPVYVFSTSSVSNPPQFLFQELNPDNNFTYSLNFLPVTLSGMGLNEGDILNEPPLSSTNVVQGASFPLWLLNDHSFASEFGVTPFGTAHFATDATGGSLDVTAVSTTPLPAALPLFASGLAGLGWFARRRRKHAAA